MSPTDDALLTLQHVGVDEVRIAGPLGPRPPGGGRVVELRYPLEQNP